MAMADYDEILEEEPNNLAALKRQVAALAPGSVQPAPADPGQAASAPGTTAPSDAEIS